MIQVQCSICTELTPPILTLLVSPIVSTLKKEQLLLVSKEIISHMERSHPSELNSITQSTAIWASFMVLRDFYGAKTEGGAMFEVEKEELRDKLVDMVMKGSQEEADDEEEEDMLEEEEEDDDNCNEDEEEDDIEELEDGEEVDEEDEEFEDEDDELTDELEVEDDGVLEEEKD